MQLTTKEVAIEFDTETINHLIGEENEFLSNIQLTSSTQSERNFMLATSVAASNRTKM